MTTSTDISSRFWNLPQKADEETARESTFIRPLAKPQNECRLDT